MSKRIDEVHRDTPLQQGEGKAGYRVAGNLRTAAAHGASRTVLSNQLLTRQTWLDQYLAALRRGNYGRGLERGPRPTPEAAGEARA
jgi:hypothetical protein